MQTALGMASAALTLSACSAALDPVAAAPIASVWRARCGACHLPVEPGARSRQALDEALARHHARVRLTPREWVDLEAWLSQPAGGAHP